MMVRLLTGDLNRRLVEFAARRVEPAGFPSTVVRASSLREPGASGLDHRALRG
jgi:hypothetical protein